MRKVEYGLAEDVRVYRAGSLHRTLMLLEFRLNWRATGHSSLILQRNLLLHPHIHCAIPAGGLSPDHRQWVRPRYPFFLPVKVLSRVF
ncbi:MAG: transposase, partial [Candidatus Sulfotelmatobacter sp.]